MLRSYRVVSAAASIAAALVFGGCKSTSQPAENAVTVQPVDQTETKTPVAPVLSLTSIENGIAKGSLALPTGDKTTSALVLEKAVPTEVVAGKPFAYELKVTNISKNKLEGVQVVEMLPGSLKLQDLASGSTLKDGVATHVIGMLAPGESKTLKVTGVASGAGAFSTCTTASYNSALCMSTVAVQPALKLTKSLPAEVLMCDPILAKYVISNSGSGVAKTIKIEDTLPAGLTTAEGKSSISVDAGTLAAGETREVSFNLKATKAGEYASKAIAKADDGLTSDSGDVKVIVRQPKLEVKFEGPEKEFIGRPFTYNYTVTNTGDGAAKDSVLIATLPEGAKYEKAGDGGIPIDASHVQWSLGELAPKASKKVSLAISGAVAGTLKNSVAAQARCAETVTAAKETSLTGISAILVEAIDVSDPLEVGQNQTYIITVTNQGSAPGTNIKLVCTMEDQMEFISATGQTNGKADGKTITFEPLASLGAKGKSVWQVVVKAKEAGDVRFKINVTSDQLTRPVEETESSNFYK